MAQEEELQDQDEIIRQPRKSTGRRLNDSTNYNMAKLAMTALIVLTPVITSFFLLYGNIRVLQAQTRIDGQRIDQLERLIRDKEFVALEQFNLFRTQNNSAIARNSDRILMLEINFPRLDLRKKQD